MPAALIEAHVEARWPAFYFNPRRWPTADGYVPFRLFLLRAACLFPLWAMERIVTAQAISLALASDDAQGRQAREGARTEAYPEAVTRG